MASLNPLYLYLECAVASRIGSVALFADSVNILEGASLKQLIALALSWSVSQRGKLGMVLAGLLDVTRVRNLTDSLNNT